MHRRSGLTRRNWLQGFAGAWGLAAASYRRVLGANERIGVGFIGYGLIGKKHVVDFRAQSDVDLVALAEVHRGRLEEGLADMGSRARGHADFRRMFEDRSVDAVVISTPDHWHALQTMLACAAGKDVYVEKPLTLFVREGRWMVDVARRTQRVVQVGTQQRSGRHYERARELIQGGSLGRIVSVRMAAYRNVWPGFGRPADQSPPAELDWDMWLGPAPSRPYNPNRCLYHFRWFWDYSGGQMTNLAAHSLDILHWYLGIPGPRAVSSSGGRLALEDNGETPDTQDALLEYRDVIASWSHREAAGGGFRPPAIEFNGTKGSLSLSRSGFAVTADRKVRPENMVPQFTGSQPVGGVARTAESGPVEFWTTPRDDKSGSSDEQFTAHARNFLDCVKSRQRPVSDLESGHQVATACHLANISLRIGRKLRWDGDQESVLGDAEAEEKLSRPYRAPWDRELQSLDVG